MKTIPAALLSHLALPVTTWCYLVKVECVGTFAGTLLGFTNLDVDVSYDDGDGVLLYESDNGFSPRRLAQSSGINVDMSEIDGIVADAGITEAKIRAGLFNSAKMTMYRINYEDLTAGRHEIVAYGRAGQTTFHELGFNVEFRSLSQLLKQPIGRRISLTCTTGFGSPLCGMPFEWTSGSVTSQGPETDRIFNDTGMAAAAGYYSDIGGVVEFLTGNNAGAEMEIEVYTVGHFELMLPLPYPILPTDTYRARRDCDKKFETCRDVYANDLNNRSENLTPVDGTAMVPGAEIVKAK